MNSVNLIELRSNSLPNTVGTVEPALHTNSSQATVNPGQKLNSDPDIMILNMPTRAPAVQLPGALHCSPISHFHPAV